MARQLRWRTAETGGGSARTCASPRCIASTVSTVPSPCSRGGSNPQTSPTRHQRGRCGDKSWRWRREQVRLGDIFRSAEQLAACVARRARRGARRDGAPDALRRIGAKPPVLTEERSAVLSRLKDRQCSYRHTAERGSRVAIYAVVAQVTRSAAASQSGAVNSPIPIGRLP